MNRSPAKDSPEARPARAALKLEQGVVTSHRVRDIIRERNKAKAKRDREQRELLDNDLLWHDQILQKIQTEDRIDPITGEWFAPTAQLANFAKCGHQHVYRTCVGCDETETHFYHCMIKWCPLCNWRITERRRQLLKQWLPTISQPKHIVTTQRNSAIITSQMIKQHTLNLARLRRCDVFAKVKGGCVSVELTNESRGWHLHAHWLVDARWIDAGELARTWGRLVGQDYAIVKVIDLRGRGGRGDYRGDGGDGDHHIPPVSYEREITKYVIKGSDLARWSGEEILQFIEAVRGKRFFFAFGELFKRARQLRAQAECNKPPPTACDCGCSQFIFTTDESQRRRKLDRRSR